MDRTRLKLDNPAFDGRLRYTHRSSAYVQRPVQYHSTPSKIQDVIAPSSRTTRVSKSIRLVSASIAAAPDKQPKHRVVPASGIHTRPPKAKPLQRTARKPIARSGRRRSGTKRSKQTLLLYAMATFLLVIGLTVSLNGLHTNRQIAAQVKRLQASSASGGSSAGGADNSAPSTKKPTAGQVASYAVGPNLPRYIDMPKLSVHARMLSLGVLASGALATPGNVYDAGWYNASSQPGQPGAMLVDGHISSWTTHGVFYGLNKLVGGDKIIITRGDGKLFTYKVIKTQIFDAKRVDMSSLLVSQDTSKPGLNLISCSGDVIPGTNEFDKRIVVYAEME